MELKKEFLKAFIMIYFLIGFTFFASTGFLLGLVFVQILAICLLVFLNLLKKINLIKII